jgi:hypothetical protein
MLRRIERVVSDLRGHAALARELSLGLVQAVSVLALGRAELEDAVGRHERSSQSELPGF